MKKYIEPNGRLAIKVKPSNKDTSLEATSVGFPFMKPKFARQVYAHDLDVSLESLPIPHPSEWVRSAEIDTTNGCLLVLINPHDKGITVDIHNWDNSMYMRNNAEITRATSGLL